MKRAQNRVRLALVVSSDTATYIALQTWKPVLHCAMMRALRKGFKQSLQTLSYHTLFSMAVDRATDNARIKRIPVKQLATFGITQKSRATNTADHMASLAGGTPAFVANTRDSERPPDGKQHNEGDVDLQDTTLAAPARLAHVYISEHLNMLRAIQHLRRQLNIPRHAEDEDVVRTAANTLAPERRHCRHAVEPIAQKIMPLYLRKKDKISGGRIPPATQALRISTALVERFLKM